jgi:hypothetical protein
MVTAVKPKMLPNIQRPAWVNRVLVGTTAIGGFC